LSVLDAAAHRSLVEALEQDDLGALVVLAPSSADPDLAPFVGDARLGESCLLAHRDGRAVLGCFTPMERDEAGKTGLEIAAPAEGGANAPSTFGERAAGLILRLLEEHGGPVGRPLALAGRAPVDDVLGVTRALEAREYEIEGGSALCRRWRRTKSEWQLDDVRAAAAGVCAAMFRVAALLRRATTNRNGLLCIDGRTLRIEDLQREVGEEFGRRGLEQPEGQIISSGRTAAVPHSRGTADSELRAGESIIVDLYPRSHLFADCTRTFVVGEAGEALRRVAELVRRALTESEEKLRPGVLARTLQEEACQMFEGAGFATLRSAPGTTRGYVHGLGHGVGFELHELPSFRAAGEDGTLRVGDVVTVEPGLYDPEAGYGVRLEDLLWLGPNGVENLTRLPYEPDPGEWEASE